MTTTNTAAAAAVKGYTVAMTVVTAPEASVIATGTDQVKFRAKMTLRGRETERTVLAQGKSAALVRDLVVGNDVTLRVSFEEAPAQEEGQRGGQFLAVLGVPTKKAA